MVAVVERQRDDVDPRSALRPDVAAMRRRSLGRIGQILAFTVLFLVALFPISVAGMAVNYVFVLLPVVAALLYGRARNPSELLVFAIAVYASIFFAASLYQYEFATDSVRRFSSFAIFMSAFSLAFMKIDEPKVVAFKTALVITSTYLSLISAYSLLSLEATRAVVGFEAKNLIGTQRVGYIYLLALWLVYLDPQQRKFWGLARYPIVLVLVAGLLLTFSRSSVIALLASVAVFAFYQHSEWLKRLDVRSVVNGIVTLIGVSIGVAVLYQMFPLAFRFFDTRLFSFFSDEQQVVAALADESTSEGTRLYITFRILEFVIRNPFTGAGYLGPWALRDPAFGSAHGQYLDVLFRTGPVGFFLYIGILLWIMRYLKRSQQALFFGMSGALVYGLFHETFKESQGAFILAFLIGMAAQAWRDRRDARRRAKAPPGPSPSKSLAAPD
jgi:O-antigen ligase